jgi:hypothetical protein
MIDFNEMRQQLDLLPDEELVEILREHDMEQWRPEVFDIVSSILNKRGVSAGKDSEPEEDILDKAANLDIVTVASYINDSDAETDRQALEAKGLKAWVVNQDGSLEADPSAPVHLQVCKEDIKAAMQILEIELSEPAPSSDLPPDIAEPPCPKCGSRKVMEALDVIEKTHLYPEQFWLYHCASCGHKWSES